MGSYFLSSLQVWVASPAKLLLLEQDERLAAVQNLLCKCQQKVRADWLMPFIQPQCIASYPEVLVIRQHAGICTNLKPGCSLQFCQAGRTPIYLPRIAMRFCLTRRPREGQKLGHFQILEKRQKHACECAIGRHLTGTVSACRACAYSPCKAFGRLAMLHSIQIQAASQR